MFVQIACLLVSSTEVLSMFNVKNLYDLFLKKCFPSVWTRKHFHADPNITVPELVDEMVKQFYVTIELLIQDRSFYLIPLNPSVIPSEINLRQLSDTEYTLIVSGKPFPDLKTPTLVDEETAKAYAALWKALPHVESAFVNEFAPPPKVDTSIPVLKPSAPTPFNAADLEKIQSIKPKK